MKNPLKSIVFKLPYMTNCREIESFIHDYVEDELPVKLKRKLYMHLLFCADCREYIKEYKQSIETEKSVIAKLDSQTSEEIPEELIKFVLENTKHDD